MADYQLTQNPDVILRTADGASIPTKRGNKDYRNYLDWVAAGNTADPASVIPNPTNIPAIAFLLRFQTSERGPVAQACMGNAQLFIGLMLIVSGSADLTGTVVQNWLNALVTAGALTAGRATAILTP
jgi:hypothetical protein